MHFKCCAAVCRMAAPVSPCPSRPTLSAHDARRAPAVRLVQPQAAQLNTQGRDDPFLLSPDPNPAKVALFLEEAGLDYEVFPVDTSKGEQHLPAFRSINPNGKVPAIIDTDGPGGIEARVFDSSAILLYLADKTQRFAGKPSDRPELLSWLFFISSDSAPSPARRCTSSTPRPRRFPMRSTGTGGKSNGTIVCLTSTCRDASSSWETNIRSSICPRGDGWSARHECWPPTRRLPHSRT